MQVAPIPLLAHLVRHFLIIEADSAHRHRIFSDGNTGIVFNCGDKLLHENPFTQEKTVLPDSFIYGQLNQYQHVVSTGKVKLIIVVLHSGSASKMLGIPAYELKDYLLDLQYFFRSDTEKILSQLFLAAGTIERCGIIENFLLHKVILTTPVRSLADEAVQLIQQHHGSLPVRKLLNELQVSERKLQRVFDEQIGLSPKRYSGVVRLQRFLKLLRKNAPGEAITTPVYECGFYDHAHLIREMKQFSGVTPSQYINQKMLAANFFQLPS